MAAKGAGKRSSKGGKKSHKPNKRVYTYDRDIICLPKSNSYTLDGLIKIPRKKSVRDYLASNRLIGKIRLHSEMGESAIMKEIRSVFREPMNDSCDFPFKLLQMSGGGSKTLSEPVVSSTYKWTASAVAGRNSKVPIYILASRDLKVGDRRVV